MELWREAQLAAVGPPKRVPERPGTPTYQVRAPPPRRLCVRTFSKRLRQEKKGRMQLAVSYRGKVLRLRNTMVYLYCRQSTQCIFRGDALLLHDDASPHACAMSLAARCLRTRPRTPPPRLDGRPEMA